jgi:hypothetical protein
MLDDTANWRNADKAGKSVNASRQPLQTQNRTHADHPEAISLSQFCQMVNPGSFGPMKNVGGRCLMASQIAYRRTLDLP